MFYFILMLLILSIVYTIDFPGGPSGFATCSKIWIKNKTCFFKQVLLEITPQ